MDDAALSGVVMDYAVPFVCDFLAASVGSSGNGRFAIPSADDLDAAMINCDNVLPPIFVIQPHETEQLAAARCSVSWGRKRVDSTSCRRENAVFPVRRKPPMWVRGIFHAPTSSRQSARHLMGSPQSCKTLWGEEGQQNE